MQIFCNKCTLVDLNMNMTIYFFLSFFLNLIISDYSTQQLSAVNDGPGGGGGTGIYLDHNQYSSSSHSSRGSIIGTDFGSNTVKHVPSGEKLDFSSPSLYTNSSGGLGNDGGFLRIVAAALAIFTLTSILFTYSQQIFSTSPWSRYEIYYHQDKKFMDRRNVDMRMKHEEENKIHNIQYLKKYVAYKNSDSGSHSNISESGNQNKKGSMVCVLCI